VVNVKKSLLQGAYARGNMVILLEETMDMSRTVYFHTCEDRNCPGMIIVEYTPAIVVGSAFRPEFTDRHPCPICGGDMKTVLMEAGGTEIIPDPGWPEQIQAGMTLYSRTPFLPTIKRKVDQTKPLPSETEAPTPPSATPEQLKDLTERLFTDEDLAGLFKVSKRVIATWVKDKRIRPVKLTEKNKRLYTKAIIEDFVQRESGLIALQSPGMGNIPAPRPRKSVSIEESRNLVKKMRKKIESDK
jgi:hypothetical protein